MGCVRVCLPIYAFLWKDTERAPSTTPINHQLRKKMERGMVDGKRDGGRHRKQHLEKTRGGDRGEVDEWMEQSLMELALIELGSVVYIL